LFPASKVEREQGDGRVKRPSFSRGGLQGNGSGAAVKAAAETLSLNPCIIASLTRALVEEFLWCLGNLKEEKG